jgi:hypothetical protein
MAIDSAFVGVGFQPWGVSVCVCAAGDATLMCGQVSDRLPIYEEDLYRVVHLQVLPDSSRQFTLEGIKMNVHLPSRTLLLLHSPPVHNPAVVHYFQRRFLRAPQSRQLPRRLPQWFRVPARPHFLE